jgi:transposase
MSKSYSADLRKRVIEAVEAGASRREAAESFGIDASSAVRWLQCWNETGRCAPKPRGGSVSPLEQRAEQILALVTQQPDLTLEETIAELLKRRIRTSKSAVSRFFQRHGITFKKKRVCERQNSTAPTWPGRVAVGSESKVCLIRPGWCLLTRPRSLPRWCGFGVAVREASN